MSVDTTISVIDTQEYDAQTHAFCSLSRPDEETVIQFIDSGSCIKFRRWIRVQSMISILHPKTNSYFRSVTARRAEDLKHLSNYFNMAHPFSLCALYWEFLMFFVFIYMTVVHSLNAICLFKPIIFKIQIFRLVGDCIFLIDFIHYFCTGYYDTDHNKTIFQLDFVAEHYLRTSLVIDFLCLSPMFILLLEWTDIIADTEESIWGLLRFLGILRMVRLQRWLETLDLLREYYKFSSYFFKFLNTLFLYFIILFSLYTSLFVLTSYIKKEITTFSNLDRYFDATLILMVISYGNTEYYTSNWIIVVVTFLCIGVILELFLHTQVLQIWNKFTCARTKHDVLDQYLEEYMSNKGLSLPVRKKMRLYFKIKFHKKFYDENNINYILPQVVRKDILVRATEKYLRRSPIFQMMGAKVLGKIVGKLTTEIYLPDDVIVKAGTTPNCMYFIYYGTVAVYNSESKELDHLHDEAYFGEYSMLFKEASRFTFSCVSATELIIVKRKDFFEIMKRHQQLKLDILYEMQSTYLDEINKLERSSSFGSDI